MKTFYTTKLCFAAAVCYFSTAVLFAEDYGQITVQPLSLSENRTEPTLHGYVEQQFRITNKGEKTVSVALSSPLSGQNRRFLHRNYLEQIKSSADVPAGTSVVIRLQQPRVELPSDGSITVSINGVRQEKELTVYPANHFKLGYHSCGAARGHILTSQNVPAETRDLIRTKYNPSQPPQEDKDDVKKTETVSPAVISPAITPENENMLLTYLSSVPVSEWSDSFLFYTRFDCVALTAKEYSELETGKPAVLSAIRKYTELGGLLCIAVDNRKEHNWKAPKEWTAAEDKNSYKAIFGSVYILGKLKGNEEQINPFRDTVLGKSADLSYSIAQHSLFTSLPVIAHYGIPVKLILILIFVFAVIIGPVNIFVLAYLKKRIYLLWTVPLLSFIACAAVLGISLLSEGLLFQSSSVSLTVLDQRREEALTAGYAGYYSTFTPAGLTFSPDTEVTFCGDDGGYSDCPLLLRYELKNGNQLFTDGWIQARIPAYFLLRKAQTQRKERINFDFSGSEATAVNGLGVPVRRLSVRSPEGQLYEAENIKAGEKVVLTKHKSKPSKPSLNETNENMLKGFRQLLRSAVQVPYSEDILPAGSYFAETDTWNPFLETGLENLKPYQNTTCIYGFFE